MCVLELIQLLCNYLHSETQAKICCSNMAGLDHNKFLIVTFALLMVQTLQCTITYIFINYYTVIDCYSFTITVHLPFTLCALRQ